MKFELFSVIVLIAVVAQYAIEALLLRRHLRHVTSHRTAVPDPFSESISLTDHQRAADYTVARGQLGKLESSFGVLVTLAILFGGLAALWQLSAQISNVIWVRELLLVALLSAVTGIIGLPFSYYGTFNIEARFGFNKTTQKTFWIDLVKGTLLGAVIMLPLLALLFWLMRGAGAMWWLYAWAVFIGFQLLMLALYPTFIAPLFNKFKPLDQADTKAAIEGLMQRTQFESNGLFVMDGSKRSSHGNAYFTGFGKAKRIVFFDTLLERLNNNEIVAVLAHELGHFKRKHIVQRLAMMAVLSLAFFAATAWAMQQPWLFTAFGFAADTGAKAPGVALILFAMVLPALLFWIGPLSSALSRRHEFEADAYAASVSSKDDLIAALTKLYRDNASTLTPDALYSAYHHSHPPAMIRIAHLQGLQKHPSATRAEVSQTVFTQTDMNLQLLSRLTPSSQHGNPAFSSSQVDEHLAVLPGWSLEHGSVQKTFTFKNYYETIAFVNVIAAISHATDHHPDLSAHYNRCVVAFNTHDVDNGKGGISINDFICAARIESFLL